MIFALVSVLLVLFVTTATALNDRLLFSPRTSSSGEKEIDLDSIIIPKKEATKYLQPRERKLKNCGGGQWHEEGYIWDDCHNCGGGKYQDSNSHTSSNCKSCPGGQYQNLNGARGCKGNLFIINSSFITSFTFINLSSPALFPFTSGCPLGFYQHQNAKTGCYACGAGLYQDQTFKTGCKGSFVFFSFHLSPPLHSDTRNTHLLHFLSSHRLPHRQVSTCYWSEWLLRMSCRYIPT